MEGLAFEFLLLGLSIPLIWKGADWLVDSAAKIARKLGVSLIVIGLTVVAFGTSAPEFAVSVSSALRGFGSIAVSNIVGSNIWNICLILGLCALAMPLKTTKKLITRDCTVMIFGAALLTLFIFDLFIGRIEGLILFASLIVYLLFLTRAKEAPRESEVSIEKAKWIDVPLFIVGLSGVLIGAHLLVSSSVEIARTIGISEWAIGVTIVAFGTSVPELATSMVAAIHKYYGISVGNLVGSNIFNIFGVVGVAGIIANMTLAEVSRYSLFVMLAIALIATVLMRTGWGISRKEGLLLVGLGVLKWYLLLVVWK